MSNNQPKFDPTKYKQTTREQWETAADAWHRWGPLLSEWLGSATEVMFDMTGIDKGNRVLDVAAGAGQQTIAAAQRVGPDGYVLATDLSPVILKFVAQAAKEVGFDYIETRELDGEKLTELEPDSFDAVICRVGMIYFPDQQKALAGMKHVLKPGGKVAAMVYSTAEKNGFFSIPVSVIRRRASLPPVLVGQPGPFNLGSDGVLEEVFIQAGFRNVRSEKINAPVLLSSAAECLRFEKESFGALHQMLAGLSVQEQDNAWDEIADELKKFEHDGRFEGPCELIVAVGTK